MAKNERKDWVCQDCGNVYPAKVDSQTVCPVCGSWKAREAIVDKDGNLITSASTSRQETLPKAIYDDFYDGEYGQCSCGLSYVLCQCGRCWYCHDSHSVQAAVPPDEV